MLERARGLSPDALSAIAELEREVVEADGGRLKLEWRTLRTRRGDRVEDLLWWGGERLCGFLGLYAFASPVELAGMVAPSARRQGVGSALLDAAMALCAAAGEPTASLIVPRASKAGRALALARGGALEHSEHALRLSGRPPSSARISGVSVRPARSADGPVITRLLEAGFGPPTHVVAEAPDPAREPTLVIEHHGEAAGTIRVTRHALDAGVYGFVVDPELRGRGIGREALRQVCGQLATQGVARIGLEVAVENERALTLYTSLGFRPVTTEDYYALPTG